MRYTPKQYARAIRAAVGTTVAFRSVVRDLEAAASAFGAHAGVSNFLASRVVPTTERVATLEAMISGVFHPTTVRTLLLLVRHGQFRELRAVAHVAEQIADAEEGIAHVAVLSAHAIPAAARERMESVIADRMHKRITAAYAEDASVIGGLCVTIDGTSCWDGTTAGKLKKLAACLAMPTTLQ